MMVDIHCHILAGLDDGASSLEESVEMAEMAIADGITHVVATPHSNGEYQFDPQRIRERRDELQDKVGNRLTLATGCDFHLSYENVQDIKTNIAKYTINQKNYLLVEFADFAIPPSADDTLHQLHLLGLSPIITHPERNRLLRAQPDRLRAGCTRAATCKLPRNHCSENGERERKSKWRNGSMKTSCISSPAMRTTPRRGR